MQKFTPKISVVGIDVGGKKKGLHAVALENGRYKARFATGDIDSMRAWCVDEVQALVIAVDAPCRWSFNDEARLAERELLRKRIWCFSTPTRHKADSHPGGYYGWMLQGEALYDALKPTHPIAEAWPPHGPRYLFETFPHAIAWHLRGGDASARQKRAQRRKLLEEHGINVDELTNIDWVDAALCALTAHRVVTGGKVTCYGEPETGFIVVPEPSN
ncbi:MAG: hypothetical protein RLZZ303_3376 [Candidatus Hydrogenedentota bacterium]